MIHCKSQPYRTHISNWKSKGKWLCYTFTSASDRVISWWSMQQHLQRGLWLRHIIHNPNTNPKDCWKWSWIRIRNQIDTNLVSLSSSLSQNTLKLSLKILLFLWKNNLHILLIGLSTINSQLTHQKLKKLSSVARAFQINFFHLFFLTFSELIPSSFLVSICHTLFLLISISTICSLGVIKDYIFSLSSNLRIFQLSA